MKILFLANHFNTGGISSYLLTLTRGLTDAGCEVYAMTSGGNCVDEFKKSGGKHLEFGFRVKSDADPKIYFALPLVEMLKRVGIDVIHSNTRATQIMGERYAKLLRAHHVSTCHGFFKTRLWRLIYPCWGKRVIAISRPVYDHLVNDFRLNPSQVVLVPNGIDLTKFVIPRQEDREAARRKFGISGGPAIGIIARLSDVKGHADLIKAFKDVIDRFPEARLLIIGEGPLEDELKRLAALLQLSRRIDFLPIVNRTADFLPVFDVFVMPSLQEGLGLSVLEAQAMGLPVVVSRVGGLPDIVEHNRTGLLVDPQSPKLLAEAICSVLSNPAKAWDMGRAARMFVEKHYSSAQMVRSTLEMYQGLGKS